MPNFSSIKYVFASKSV